ncbi:hypothetical protein DRQ33_08280 [bacterium]|nr:MAG: hypothetical protein DRQ33_08280 [bacterium]
MERRIEKMNHREFRNLVPEKIDTCFLPIGTMEAHGCTNLGTDITIPEFICSTLAEKTNSLIAPTISYGITRTLLPYPGSMTVSPESFQRYVSDVVISIFRAGFKQLIIINGHGGHYDELRTIAKLAWEKQKGKTIVIHWWELCEHITKEIFSESGGHAGINETAMVLSADETLVSPELCKEIKPFFVRDGSYVYPNPAPMLFYKKDERKSFFDKNSPRLDKEKAKKYSDAVLKYIEKFINEVKEGWKINL